VGIGLAFNNTIEPINHLVLSEDSAIRVVITRGPAQMAVDNNPGVIPVDRGDQITIRRADHNAVILAYDWVRYPADQFIFHQTRAEAEADD
jgi:NAD kinase